MTHQVTSEVIGADRISFLTVCRYLDGMNVLCSASTDVSSGLISRMQGLLDSVDRFSGIGAFDRLYRVVLVGVLGWLVRERCLCLVRCRGSLCYVVAYPERADRKRPKRHLWPCSE
jgi:hypothetical protein